MAIRDIRLYPDPILKRKALFVDEVDEEITRLIDDMAETMYAAPGIGLAAPQVGVLLRVVVVDAAPRDQESKLISLVNPEIVWSDRTIIQEEGCLSIPGMNVDMERNERIQLIGLDREGKEIDIQAEGLQAISLQHEIDHLEGRLIVDRVSRLKRDIYRRKMKKAASA